MKTLHTIAVVVLGCTATYLGVVKGNYEAGIFTWLQCVWVYILYRMTVGEGR